MYRIGGFLDLVRFENEIKKEKGKKKKRKNIIE